MAKTVREIITTGVANLDDVVIGIVRIDEVTANSKKIHYNTNLLGLVVIDNNGNVITKE
jgi:hypothetical protein